MRFFHLACAAILLFVPPMAWAQTAVIEGDTEFEQGRKIVLDASKSDADSVAWIGLNGVEFEQVGEKVFIWANPGSYSVTLVSVKVVDGKGLLATKQHSFKVLGVVPPGPDPVPPVPPVPPKPDLEGVSLEAYNAIRESGATAEEIKVLAFDLKFVATQAASLNWTPADISAEFTKRARQLFIGDEIKGRWGSYNTWQTQAIKANAADSKSLVRLFYDIAEGLEAAIATPRVSESDGTLKDVLKNIKTDLQGIQREIGP
ncbi:MAG TPA: hypothetical protein VLA12_02965 [Planctomycetaceae bacterium]|nr:hypothetical protein [Planctomycetaceae bacterium]